MKPFIILVFSIFSFFTGFSQPWPKVFSQWPDGHQGTIIETYDNGYMFLINGYKNYKYAIIAKCDINGYLRWFQTIGNNTIYFGNGSIDKTIDGGLAYCSGFNKYDQTGSSDPFVVKLNACGELDWCSVINTPGIFDFAERVRQTPDDQYVLLTSYSDPEWYNRIQLYKLNSTGDLIWKRNYPGDSIVFNEDGYDVQLLSDGYLITGMGYAPDSGQTGGGYERPYFIRTDTAGNMLWRLAYGTINGFMGSSAYNHSTITSYSGNFYEAGRHSNFCDTPALFKCMNNGTEGYYQDVMPDACPGGLGVLNILNDTAFILFAGGTINGSLVLKWLKMDTLGNVTYSKTFPDGWITNSGNSIVTFDKKIVSLSNFNLQIYLYKLNQQFEFDSIYTHPYVYDSLCPHPIVSDTIDPDCGLIVDVTEAQRNPETTKLRVFPSPAQDNLSVQFPKYLVVSSGSGRLASTAEYHRWKSTQLEVYNLQGRLVYTREIPGTQPQLDLDVSAWPRGMYLFRLLYEGRKVGEVKAVIR